MEKKLESKLQNKINIVDFWAKWCFPCQTLGPILESIESENPDVNLIKIDVDENLEMANEYGIRSIPTVIFVDKEGNKIKISTGLKDKNYFNEILGEIRGKNII